MEFVLKENPDLNDDQVILECKAITPDILEAVRVIKQQENRKIIVYKDGAIHKIDLEDVYYFEFVERRLFVYLESEVFESRQTLGEVEELIGESFIRTSRTTIVNWSKISALKPILSRRFEAVLDNGESLIITRNNVSELKRKFLGNQ